MKTYKQDILKGFNDRIGHWMETFMKARKFEHPETQDQLAERMKPVGFFKLLKQSIMNELWIATMRTIVTGVFFLTRRRSIMEVNNNTSEPVREEIAAKIWRDLAEDITERINMVMADLRIENEFARTEMARLKRENRSLRHQMVTLNRALRITQQKNEKLTRQLKLLKSRKLVTLSGSKIRHFKESLGAWRLAQGVWRLASFRFGNL